MHDVFPFCIQLVLKDLTQCDEAAMHKLLEEAATPRLQRMELGMAGRGFGPKVGVAVDQRRAPFPTNLNC